MAERTIRLHYEKHPDPKRLLSRHKPYILKDPSSQLNLQIDTDMFTLQLKCPKCGFHTLTEDEVSINDVLCGDELGSEWTICTCLDCKQFFQRRRSAEGIPIDKCRICGGDNIVVHDKDHQSDICPVCGFDGLEVDYSTITSYF